MSSTTPWKAGLVIWIASAGTALAISLLVSEPAAPSRPVEAVRSTSHEELTLGRLEARLAALENRFHLLSLHADPDPGGVRAAERGIQPLVIQEEEPPVLAELESRLAQLEVAEVARIEALAEEERRLAMAEEAQREQAQARARRAHDIILDPTSSEVAKAEAWRELRRLEGDGVWTDEVVSEMARVGQFAQDAEIRRNVWRGADGRRTHELLVEPLLHAMQNDPSNRVREEAADALSAYADLDHVMAALKEASVSDADPEVREEALEALVAQALASEP